MEKLIKKRKELDEKMKQYGEKKKLLVTNVARVGWVPANLGYAAGLKIDLDTINTELFELVDELIDFGDELIGGKEV